MFKVIKKEGRALRGEFRIPKRASGKIDSVSESC